MLVSHNPLDKTHNGPRHRPKEQSETQDLLLLWPCGLLFLLLMTCLHAFFCCHSESMFSLLSFSKDQRLIGQVTTLYHFLVEMPEKIWQNLHVPTPSSQDRKANWPSFHHVTTVVKITVSRERLYCRGGGKKGWMVTGFSCSREVRED